MERLPDVTPSLGLAAVDARIICTRDRSTSSSSAAICASAVTMPWPISTLPGETVTCPSLENFSHAGWAAQSGIRAALLARAGFVGPRTVFEGVHGLFHGFARSTEGDYDALIGDFGTRWVTDTLAFKPYPWRSPPIT